MSDKEDGSKSEQAEWHPEPAESFAIEYLNTRLDITRAMGAMNFSERSRSSVDENTILIKGENIQDGTTIEMTIRKGDRYKSPKEIADLEAEKQKGK